MALVTPLSPADAREVLAAWGVELERIVPLPAHGTVNSNFRVHARGRDFFLRVNEGKRDEDVVAESELVTRLREGGLPTPEVLRTSAGGWFARAHGKPVTLFPWVDGREAEPHPDRPETVRVVGRALALLHQAGSRLEAASLPRNHYSLDELERRLGTFAGDPRFAEVVDLLAEELERARRSDAQASGLIHQDLFPDNLLVDAGGALVAVLDLEQATYGRFVYDLAVAATSWCWDGRAHRRQAIEAMLAAYQEVRPLSDGERGAIVDEARLAAARFTITRITDVFLPTGVDPDLRRRKDWRDFSARLMELRAELH